MNGDKVENSPNPDRTVAGSTDSYTNNTEVRVKNKNHKSVIGSRRLKEITRRT